MDITKRKDINVIYLDVDNLKGFKNESPLRYTLERNREYERNLTKRRLVFTNKEFFNQIYIDNRKHFNESIIDWEYNPNIIPLVKNLINEYFLPINKICVILLGNIYLEKNQLENLIRESENDKLNIYQYQNQNSLFIFRLNIFKDLDKINSLEDLPEELIRIRTEYFKIFKSKEHLKDIQNKIIGKEYTEQLLDLKLNKKKKIKTD